jgi:hypothetical protein
MVSNPHVCTVKIVFKAMGERNGSAAEIIPEFRRLALSKGKAECPPSVDGAR